MTPANFQKIINENLHSDFTFKFSEAMGYEGLFTYTKQICKATDVANPNNVLLIETIQAYRTKKYQFRLEQNNVLIVQFEHTAFKEGCVMAKNLINFKRI